MLLIDAAVALCETAATVGVFVLHVSVVFRTVCRVRL